MVVKSGQITGNFPSTSDGFCVFITFVFNITYLTLNLYNLMSIMAMFYPWHAEFPETYLLAVTMGKSKFQHHCLDQKTEQDPSKPSYLYRTLQPPLKPPSFLPSEQPLHADPRAGLALSPCTAIVVPSQECFLQERWER